MSPKSVGLESLIGNNYNIFRSPWEVSVHLEAEKFPWLLTTLKNGGWFYSLCISPIKIVQGQAKQPATERFGCSGVHFPSSLSAPEVQLYLLSDYKWFFFGN